jgi:hypothetical protein
VALPSGAECVQASLLVALSSIRECRDDWLQDPKLFADFPEFLKEKDERDPLPESVERRLAEFRRWGPLTGYQERFLRLSEMTAIRGPTVR